MAKLTVESGSQRGKQFKLPESGSFSIGRDESCSFCIEDQMASREHCVVRCEPGKWVIEDSGSTNGIQVNDIPVHEHTLIPGDTIAIGDTLMSLATTDEDPLIGSTLAGYKIEKRLGRGAMGTVYLACQLSLDRQVALKILAPRFSKDEDFIQSFLKEARSAGSLNHPNVVQVYDAGNEGDYHYMSMEYLEGGSLEELLEREGRLDIIRAVNAARDAAQALQFAQQNQIVHRDIKPANLMLTLDGTVKVGDLGIAADLSQSASGGGGGNVPAAGSPRYMAPEQARGEALDHRADIYGLGATLYRMIAGVAPFDGSSVKEIIRAKLDNDPTPLRKLNPEIPGGLSAVVQKMLARNPDSRYENAAQVYSALEPSQYRKSISAKGKARAARVAVASQGARPAAGRGGTRHPRRPAQGSQSNLVVGSIIGVVALILVLVLVSNFRNDGEQSPDRGKSNEPVTSTSKPPEEHREDNPGLERNQSKLALKRLEKIQELYSGGKLDASAALLQLENLLADNPRIALSAEKLLKELGSKAELAKKEAARNRKKQATAALASIDVLIEKNELRKAADSIAAFLARYSDLGAGMVSPYQAKLGGIVRSGMDAAGKLVRQLSSSGDFEKARAEITALKARMPSSESARIQSMEAEIGLVESRRANSLKFIEDNRAGLYTMLADFDFAGARKHLDGIIGKLGGAEAVNKEAKALLELLGNQLSASRKSWEELQSFFSKSEKSKSVVKVRFLPVAKDDKELRYKVLGLEGHAVRVQESGSKAPAPVAYRILGLDTGSLVRLVGQPGASGLKEAEVFQGLGTLLLLRDGPARARSMLLSEKIPVAARKDNERILAKYVETWREVRLYSLQKLESKLSAGKQPVSSELWNFIANDTGFLITSWKTRPDYAKHRPTLHELFLRTRIASLAGASVEGAFNAKTVKQERDGQTTLSYDFSSMDQLKDFYPVGKGASSLEWIEKKRFFKLKGEARFLAANPFESRIAVNGVVPSGGYHAPAPNINVALWTEENDHVTLGLDGGRFEYNSWRESGGDGGDPPADYFALGMGYKPEINISTDLLPGGRLGRLAGLLTNVLPGYFRETSFVLLSGDHNATLHRRRDEKIWEQPVGNVMRSGGVRFS
ncbi:MAG: FHA domain-containing serine/threonine-protein kinase, partial [Planctomycetota bacterium]|nr:FHA domain-containing serine/threonine-protein kinase [Planctomycetota bacterium]